MVLSKVITFFSGTFIGKYLYPLFSQATMNSITWIQGGKLKFYTPNSVNRYRVNTYYTKEPETIEWLDGIPSGSVMWDIGANVGLYTCYAASVKGCRVIAFEPSVLNLELLAKNVYLNNVVESVTIVPLPLTDRLSFNTLNMTSMELGGAMSTFKETYGHDGLPLNALLRVPTIGLTMVDMVELLKIPMPEYIKMDVDGVEHLILGAGGLVLQNAKEILVEINDNFQEQAKLSRIYLEGAGFKMRDKRHASHFDGYLTSAATTFNQIWSKTI
jgi:FkbM family methyltransferase